MPTVDQAVKFLVENNALEIGESPWPQAGDDDQTFEIDWDRLFPPARNRTDQNGLPLDDSFSIEPTPEEMGTLGDILRRSGPMMGNSRSGRGPVGGGDDVGPEASPKWDLCAWYQPVHFFGHGWGIYIREECVRRTALRIAPYVDGAFAHAIGPARLFTLCCRAALFIYFLHEQYHHKVESLGFRLHVVQRRSSYLPYKKKVYRPATGTDNQLEESLANADAYHRLGTQPYAFWISPPVVAATKRFLKRQFPFDPPGYRCAVNYLTKPEFDAGENVLQAQVKKATLHPAQPSKEWDLAPRMMQSFFPLTSNIWTVVRGGVRSSLPLRHVSPIRTCSTREMIKLYEEAGYEVVDGGKGSHVKLKKPGAPTMILPGNRSELSPGVAKTALRVLGDFGLGDLPKLVRGGLLQAN